MTSDGRTADPSFQQLVDAVGDCAIYRLDPQGRVASWNVAAERIKGYSFDEVQGQSFRRFFTLEDQHAGVPDRILARAGAEGRAESEGWRLRKDGSRFWAAASVHAVRGQDGALSGFVKLTRDMTEHRAAQEALLESERRFRYLVEGVVDYAIYMLDVNGVVTNWNRGAERAKGYRAGEVIGKHFSVFYTPEERQAGAPARALARALHEGRWEGEGWRLRKDGSRFWASVLLDAIQDDNGRHIGFAKITRDISERKAAEEALIQSERQFRLLVASVVDYALIMLDPNGVVTSWNAGAQNIKGYAAEEIIGQHMSAFYTAPDRAAGLPSAPSKRRPPRAATRPRPGACARTAACSGPMWCWTRSTTRPASCSASPRSPATSPSGATPRSSCRRPTSAWPRPRRWKPWASSPAAWRTTSTTC
ncbi:MAG: hypothetical protein JWQ97_2788 [Phenylobacterium sp.]|nr:hypothetical protein [Phenylobacterium sp.]